MRRSDGILTVEYGEYPQNAVATNIQQTLELEYQRGNIKRTGKTYTTDSRHYNEYDKDFLAQEHIEYEYNGEKFVRVKVNSYFDGDNFELSNGEQYKDNDYVWIKVEPIKWLIDERTNQAITEKLIFAGVQFNKTRDYKGNFQNTTIKRFMDNHLARDIQTNINHVNNNTQEVNEENQIIEKKKIRRQNPYGFNFNNVSEEEIIKGALKSNVAVFLHGRSSEGKSARVKQYDPDCEIIYLRNATPESLNGKSVFNSETGEMIDVPPTWFKKISKKCEEEPDKIHIVFFDEITNALPSIQGMAFNIVLDGEVNGMWRLPKNCRIVAAGNDLNDSLAANTMAEPLFNRFAHVYINTTTDNWLKWAATPKKSYERLDYEQQEQELTIHPAIYAYIAYKAYGNQDVLRTPYNGEKPNADPRKWEMASKVLYATKQPEMLRALIGEDLTRDFIAFARQSVITVDDILNKNYDDTIFEMNIAEKFSTAVGLSYVDEEHVSVVRDFVMKLSPEVAATFDSLWSHGDESRLERIAEMRLEGISQGGVKR